MEQFYRFVFLILGFVVILFAAHFTARWMGGKTGRFGRSKFLSVIDSVSLGNECYICLMRIADVVYMIGVTKTNIQLLDKLSKADFDFQSQADVSNVFTDVFHKYFAKQFNSGEKSRHQEHEQA